MALLSVNISFPDDLLAPVYNASPPLVFDNVSINTVRVIVRHQFFVRTTQTKMFKLVVLSALLAAAVASPGAIIAPLAYTSTVVSPATTSIVRQASSVIHPSPLVYSSPAVYSAIPAYAHLIKKRSAPFVQVHTPLAYSTALHVPAYSAAPLVTSYTTPFIRTAPIYTTAHLIKKRSAPLIVPTNYIAPTTYTATPLIRTYATAPIVSSPVISYAHYGYSHLIKKRSLAVPVSTYIAPTAYSHSSRVDVHSTPAVATYTSYVAPSAYTSVVPHLFGI